MNTPIRLTLATLASLLGGVAVAQQVELPEVPAEVLSGDPLSGTATADGLDLPTMVQVTVREGVTEIIPISDGFTNRIQTPFENPKVITASDAQVKPNGRDIYVTASGTRPVGLFITPSDPNDRRAISLGLEPKAMPPRTISLTYDNSSPSVRVEAFARAANWETETPYALTLMRLMEGAARQQVPSGYSLERSNTVVTCDLPGVRLEPGQLLDGSNLAMFVMLATNMTDAPLELQEDRCYQPGVAAVAAWPNVQIPPGQSTELYVVVNKVVFYEGGDQGERRPSLVGASRHVYGPGHK